MKRLLTTVAVASLAFGTALAASPTVDEAAPAISVTTAKGELLTSADLAGKMVILEWTNHDCPFVKKHYGSNNMQATQIATTDMDAVWISVVSSAEGKQGYITPDQADELTTSRGAKPTHVVLDTTGELGRLYGAKTTPHMFVIEGDNNLAYAGAIDSISSADPTDIETAENYVMAAATALSNGAEVATKQSKPYGCSVKY